MFENIINNIPGTTIGVSQVHGFGLFAGYEVSKGSLLAILDGQIIPWWLHEEKELTEEWNALPGGRILVRPYRTKYYYVNHSREPNLIVEWGADGEVSLVAFQRIMVGEEFLLDYRKEPLPETYLKGHGATYL